MKRILVPFIFALICINYFIIMTDEERIKNLENQVSRLTSDIETINKELEKRKFTQLNYPLDFPSKRIIEDLVIDKVFDFTWNTHFYFSTIFESADGYDLIGGGAAGSGVNPDGLVLNTGAALNSSVSFNKTPSPSETGETLNLLSFKKPQRFKTNFAVNSTTNITAYITRGVNLGPNYPYYGFKIVNDSLMGVSKDNNTEGESTVPLMKISANTVYIGEVRYFPQDKIVFYILDSSTDQLKELGTLTKNLPKFSNQYNKAFFEYFVSTQDANNKMLTSSFFEYIQKR